LDSKVPDSCANAKMTKNFRPNFKHENGNFNFYTIMAAKVNAARNSKSSNVRNRPWPESFSPAIYCS
jgi:hypothetical protein